MDFGANMPTPKKYLVDIEMEVCRLVFMGIDWKRKRGEIALQTFQQLKSDRFPCTLTIIGSVPMEYAKNDSDLTIIPFKSVCTRRQKRIFTSA